MKKKLCIIMLFLFLYNLYQNNFVLIEAAELNNELPIVGESAILIDVKTGKVLYQKNANKRMEPASTTKIMTAILALEKGNLSDTVVTGSNPPLAEGTRIYLEEGEELTLEQLLYAMLLNSANDAAVAIAEHIGGNVTNFANMMNEKAYELGAKNTTFVNPNGLTEEGHLTTAYDLALMARYALLNFDDFRKIVSTRQSTIPWAAEEWDRSLYNLNKLLWKYDGADGVKTGYTRSAGQTLVASATKDGWQLIAVVLKSHGQNIWSDAKTLLDYGFENFKKIDVIEKGKVITQKDIKFGDTTQIETSTDFSVVLPKDSPTITKKINLKPNVKAPIKKGEVLGAMEFYCNNQKIGSIDLVSDKDIPRKIFTYWWFWLLVFSLFLYIPFRKHIGLKRYKKSKTQIQYVSYIKKYR